jgi:hypothetical protein
LCACTTLAPLNRAGDLARRQTAPDEPRRGARAAERRGVADQQLGLLAELLAHEPQQILYDALLPAARAIAIVHKQDHRPPEPSRAGAAGRANALQT